MCDLLHHTITKRNETKSAATAVNSILRTYCTLPHATVLLYGYVVSRPSTAKEQSCAMQRNATQRTKHRILNDNQFIATMRMILYARYGTARYRTVWYSTVCICMCFLPPILSTQPTHRMGARYAMLLCAFVPRCR